ncbi:MAG: ATP-binding protein, partial [Arenimonas sp.]|nr:ATP-binding protein [Arenimonas sp.]
LLRPGFEARLDVAEDAAALPVTADRGFDYLVLNLLDNAADASRSAGSERVSLRVRRRGGFLALAFLDEGPGLVEAPPGFRSDKPGGLGLGFALATRVCEQHGGALVPVPGGVEATLSVARLGQGA